MPTNPPAPETSAEYWARKIAANQIAHKRHKEKMNKQDPEKCSVIVGDTTGEPVGESWKECEPVFVKDGTLTNEEPTPSK